MSNPRCNVSVPPSSSILPTPLPATNAYAPVLPQLPAFTFQQIQNANDQIIPQKNRIADLAKQVADIERRYIIQFSVGNVNFYNSDSALQPSLEVTGNSVTTPVLNFTLVPPKPGRKGKQGNAGKQGNTGNTGNGGMAGFPGYWGIIGNKITNNL